MVAIQKKVSERLSKEIKRFQKILQTAHDRDVNESDTVTIITDMLHQVFGFDKYTDITSEQAIRGTYCDLAIKQDGKIKYLIEVKAIGLNLKENHLRQAVGYGANHGIPWVVLTNGINWEVYRIKFDRPISHDLVYTIDFSTLNPRKAEDQEKVFLICKEGLAKDAIEEFHDHVQSVNRFMIGAITLSEPVVNLIRRELKAICPGVKVTNEEIEGILSSEVLKRDVVNSESADEAMKRVSKGLKKKAKKKVKKKISTPVEETETPSID